MHYGSTTTRLCSTVAPTLFPGAAFQPNKPTALSFLTNLIIWQIKRTFQPSVIRKKRKTGFLVRQRTVGGRRILARRRAKGRWRLGGGI